MPRSSAAATPRVPRSSALDRSGTAHGHSAVEALLASHAAPEAPPLDAPTAPTARTAGERKSPEAQPSPAQRLSAGLAAAQSTAANLGGPLQRTMQARSVHLRPVHLPTAGQPREPLPPMQDVMLGLASVLAERAWLWGTRVVQTAWMGTTRTVGFLRGAAPAAATDQFDATLHALAARGRAVRQERTEALTTTLTTAMTTAATSDTVRDLTVAAVEDATDDVLAVVLPAVLRAVTDLETQDRLDELMAGLLLRQLPSALEKTLPGVMLRTATRPAMGLVPFFGGSAPRNQ